MLIFVNYVILFEILWTITKESTIKKGVASYISMLCSCSAICVFFLHRLNIADFASLNYWELNFFSKPAKHDVILTWHNFTCEKYIGYKSKEMKIRSYENECMYNASTTVHAKAAQLCYIKLWSCDISLLCRLFAITIKDVYMRVGPGNACITRTFDTWSSEEVKISIIALSNTVNIT